MHAAQSTFVIAPSRKFVNAGRTHDPAAMLRTVLRTVAPDVKPATHRPAAELKSLEPEGVEDAAGATVVPCSPAACSGVERRASAVQVSEPGAPHASQRGCVYTPEIVATLQSGATVLLEESDLEDARRATPEPPSDDIEPDTPVKLRVPALAVKASFLDDIDEAAVPSPAATGEPVRAEAPLLSQRVPIPPGPPRELLRFQDLIKNLEPRPASRPPPPEDGLTASQLMSNLASPPPQHCLRRALPAHRSAAAAGPEVPDSGGKRNRSVRNGLAAALDDALARQSNAFTLWRNKGNKFHESRALLLEAEHVRDEHSLCHVQCRVLQAPPAFDHSVRSLVLCLTADQARRLGPRAGVQLRVDSPWQELALQDGTLVLMCAFACEAVRDPDAAPSQRPSQPLPCLGAGASVFPLSQANALLTAASASARKSLFAADAGSGALATTRRHNCSIRPLARRIQRDPDAAVGAAPSPDGCGGVPLPSPHVLTRRS